MAELPRPLTEGGHQKRTVDDKQMCGKMIEVDGFYTIPSGCQAVVAIGSVTYGDLEIKTLDCISEGIVRGKAKIVLVEHGNFVNQPL